MGITTVVPQILLPMSAGMVPEQRRGAVTGTLLSGLLGGILLARTFSGALGGWLDWRVPYLAAAVLMLILAVVLARVLPPVPAAQPRALRRAAGRAGAADAGRAGSAPVMRVPGPDVRHVQRGVEVDRAAADRALLRPVHAGGRRLPDRGGRRAGHAVAGRRIDRVGPDRISFVSFTAGLLAAAILAVAAVPALHGAASLVLLGAGMLLLDVAVQCGQVANQAPVFGLPGEARARRNTAYMTCAFLGGSAGSWLGVRAYTQFGWGGIAG